MTDAQLLTTPLDALHRELGGRMVPFAGYAMPVHYHAGVLAEHLHCRASAALFDVSHMGQASLRGPATSALERLVPSDIAALRPGKQRYSLLMTRDGGILDDLMIANLAPDHLVLVVNASRKHLDYPHIQASLPPGVTLERHEDRALLALQGPAAAAVLARLSPEAAALPFMSYAALTLAGSSCWVSRSGYTGEDGFEISVPAAEAEILARRLLAEPEVMPAGLGARDSLRLEAGLCLYGNDIDEDTNPIEAGLGWVIGKRRKLAWDFLGGDAVRAMLEEGPPRLRVGIRPDGRAPARAGTAIIDSAGVALGMITSGGFGPSLGGPVAMGYVPTSLAAVGSTLTLVVRDRPVPARVIAMPAVPHRYIR